MNFLRESNKILNYQSPNVISICPWSPKLFCVWMVIRKRRDRFWFLEALKKGNVALLPQFFVLECLSTKCPLLTSEVDNTTGLRHLTLE